MFGGIAFFTRGNMACGVNRDAMILRFNPDDHEAMMARPDVRVFDLSGGRPMKGWLIVEPHGVASEDALTNWVRTGVDFALSPRKMTLSVFAKSASERTRQSLSNSAAAY